MYGIVRDRFQLHCILSHQLLLNNLYYYMIDKSQALWFAYMEQFRSKRRFMKLNVNITFLFFSLYWIKISWGISKTLRLVIIIHAVQSNIACLKFLGYDFKVIGLHLLIPNLICLHQFVAASYYKQYEDLATLEIQYLRCLWLGKYCTSRVVKSSN